jgi:hypothetical protein
VERRRELRVTAALDERGEVSAFTDLRVSPGSRHAVTDDTGTLAMHRRRGLARAVKLESLRRLRLDHPDVRTVATMNAEENAAMRGLNSSLGFRPTVTFTTATLSL